MSNPIAVYSGDTVLYWSSIIITLGLLAALFMTLSLQRANKGSTAAVWLMLPLAVILSEVVPPHGWRVLISAAMGTVLTALTVWLTGLTPGEKEFVKSKLRRP